MSEKEDKKKMEEKLDKLTNIVERLVEMEVKRQTEKEQVSAKNHNAEEEARLRQERMDLEEELKQYPLGEVLIFALKKNLIKKSSFDEIQRE